MLACVACASPKPAQEVAAEPASPSSLVVLDSEYPLPPYITVNDVARHSGMTRFKWRDDVSTCSGAALFETVASPEDHTAFMQREIFGEYESAWEREGVAFTHDDEELPLWDGPARLRTYALTHADRTGATGTLDRHIPSETLSVVIVFDCPAPALCRRQADTWIRILEARRRL